MIDNSQEYIICSAIWFDDGIFHMHQPFNIKTGYVIYGLRHHNCYTIMSLFSDPKTYLPLEKDEGFLTSKNRFVNRVEAYEIAKKYISKFHTKGYLYSEDLY